MEELGDFLTGVVIVIGGVCFLIGFTWLTGQIKPSKRCYETTIMKDGGNYNVVRIDHVKCPK